MPDKTSRENHQTSSTPSPKRTLKPRRNNKRIYLCVCNWCSKLSIASTDQEQLLNFLIKEGWVNHFSGPLCPDCVNNHTKDIKQLTPHDISSTTLV